MEPKCFQLYKLNENIIMFFTKENSDVDLQPTWPYGHSDIYIF